MKNLALLVTSIIFSLVLCEVGLRLFTPFPVTEESNKTDDPVLGYRLSTHLDDVDQHGFRNRPMETYDIAAIGDSFTYGSNVSSDQTWPALLGKMTGTEVYNFGVGSYGIFTYHAILKTLVKPDARGVIIGLFSANDLAMRFSFCDINFNNDEFWRNEMILIGIKPPTVDIYNKSCKKKKIKSDFSIIRKRILENIALKNAIDFLILKLIEERIPRSKYKNKKYYHFDDKAVYVDKEKSKINSIQSDLETPEINFMYNIFVKLTGSWASWSRDNNIKLGILFIPSKERVVYEYFRRNNKIDTLDTNFTRDVEKQIQLENKLSELFDKHHIYYQFSLDNTVDAFIESLQKGEEFYPINDGHTFGKGYQAYARAAYELWEEMNN